MAAPSSGCMLSATCWGIANGVGMVGLDMLCAAWLGLTNGSCPAVMCLNPAARCSTCHRQPEWLWGVLAPVWSPASACASCLEAKMRVPVEGGVVMFCETH